MLVDASLRPGDFTPLLDRFFALAAGKIRAVARAWDPAAGSPVFTVQGRYTARGWTEWTQGFQFGCQILQSDATGDDEFWRMGLANTVRFMASHVSHTGVHDHGFNNISTYGNLRRLAREGRVPELASHMDFFDLALKVSGAVQAARWTRLEGGGGFIHSFNGPHSLFSDTIRSCRILGLAHQLGHCLMGENDRRISLLARLLDHLRATVRYNVFFGEGRDRWDRSGRVAHEGIFNVTDGRFRLPLDAAGLLGLQHLDARPGLGPPRRRRRAGVPRWSSRRRVFLPRRKNRKSSISFSARRASSVSITSNTAPPMASPVGTPAPPACATSLSSRSAPRSPTTPTSLWTAPPPPSPRRASCASAATWARGARRARAGARPA